MLPEFLTTWPTARVTECFKLMSLWGFLMEYAMPEPKGIDSAAGPQGSSYLTPSREPPASDSKRVPLLSDQHL